MASLLSYALTDLASVKELLGITDTSKDNLVIRKINQATRQIENYCGRRFLLSVYSQEEYAATQVDQLVLRQRPVSSFTSLEIRDSGLNYNSWETVDTKLYFVDNSAGVLNLMFNAIGRWGRFRVTYSAGYTTIPEDLAEAAAILAAYYVTYPTGNAYVQTKMEGQRKIQFHQTVKTFRIMLGELGIDDIIDSYSNLPLATDR